MDPSADPSSPPTEIPPTPPPSPTPPPTPTPPAAPDPAAPPAAAIVKAGQLPEDAAAELVRLRQSKEADGQKIRERETRIAFLEDQNRQLRTPAPRRPAAEAKSWLDGATLLG